ncbi:Protein cwh43 [Coemansia spiralis]|uniref:Protein cwh43 n=2 Tax=Coemansia TaxID=4863 RepID=A0A9W8L060_9FUNG|nr:fgf receptor activating protein [Coemansia spiralis]KAJ1995109.1 Protein cwh43 [Coemansia umbellata]KAJ2624037.1 Protein cwh43 [Coemansia sp. RSA 1358]KAJ2679645.1 Protein cwh43 [Coemansia spiralis]
MAGSQRHDSPGGFSREFHLTTGGAIQKVTGWWIPFLHTVFAASAFLGALVIGWKLHYFKIVKNEHFGYPDEWFPSVSATIGDRYPGRNVFQILIALTAPPRLFLHLFWYILTVRVAPKRAQAFFWVGFLRTWTCGGWVYVTSGDDHDVHDVMMISYMLLTVPYMLLLIKIGDLSPFTHNADVLKLNKRRRKWVALLFFGSIPPMIYFFINHKVHRIAGAYTTYAFFEWALIIFDIMFDSLAMVEFKALDLAVLPAKSSELRD